jgi:uncharacterized membrane protein YdbT with pleckstrin-like domain
MTQEIEAVLEPQEQIVWQDVINRKAMIFNLLMALIIVTAISFFLFSQGVINYNSGNVPKSISGSTVGWFFLAAGLFFTVLSFLSDFVKIYTITNKRVLIKSGLIGTDFNSIYFTEVRTVNVNVGLIDKIFSVGTVNIDTGKIETVSSGSGDNRQSRTQTAYDKILHVSKPYEVYKYFQTTLTGRQESLYSGRADRENNPAAYENK